MAFGEKSDDLRLGLGLGLGLGMVRPWAWQLDRCLRDGLGSPHRRAPHQPSQRFPRCAWDRLRVGDVDDSGHAGGDRSCGIVRQRGPDANTAHKILPFGHRTGLALLCEAKGPERLYAEE